MSSMSYNSVYTPAAAMFRQSFNPPSLHTNGTTSATSGNYSYLPQLSVNDHQPMTSHSLQQSQSNSQQWPPSADKRNFIYQPGSGNNNPVSFSFTSNYQSTNGQVVIPV
ncbi:826_t:CDS:2 [Acaulospora morrowiae]|uniref:826_t:CDS:1 n=1 Tax=Acaulospora morrowiae TaxID=94023 RepID=A0A9N9JSH7_9GLOM|nr:826_t:CDS:2 [Acaulospora morrowiae]